MTWTSPPTKNRGAAVNFTEARAATDRAEAGQRVRAALTVAQHSNDVGDCRELLSMLGLSGRKLDAAVATHDVDGSHRDAPDARSTGGLRR
ncbi:hypothetical protein Q5530_28955 [Saccharothrix sp. BKS2]|uniref:hypothetical protein n=1 Tax=Saccharothrix sp. BKS2 TaxID=3064400 RepID=UPI0039EA2402